MTSVSDKFGQEMLDVSQRDAAKRPVEIATPRQDSMDGAADPLDDGV
jgi:hypothetical protein